ncbi:hypothetical protein A2Z67_01595 [Candidatus Woesebacteria bacterium RBG_13_36_22]|uniref:GrpB family protein n=1 Tax=Candidatus Woesebacteria bacterium RBG_13_36_22 TaxID=1802478 RepID=A0A1F7X353_9BACT|nr:MAG: hypothetical protein A2Z67_01595 [Candidatus Woesebacteria bacterium RBG_13_36_22]
MALIRRFPPEHFLRYNEKPVKIKPFSKKQEIIAKKYIARVGEILKDFDLKIMIRGSTAFKISGKGDVEIGIYPNESDWKFVTELLRKNFGEPGNVEKDYARFNDCCDDIEIEIIILKGKEARQDILLHEYLIKHPKLLKEYERIKKKYAFSKREYQIQKNRFLSRVMEKILS